MSDIADHDERFFLMLTTASSFTGSSDDLQRRRAVAAGRTIFTTEFNLSLSHASSL
jgi:hypothetical protein